MSARPLRIGCGAGYSGDRIEPAVELVERGDLDVIVFECLAERTIALAQQAKARDADAGFDPLLEERMEAILPEARRRRIRIVTNMGAANAPAAADCVRQVAARLGVGGFTIAVVTGDDVRELAGGDGFSRLAETGEAVNIDDIVSANAYLGAEPIAEALRRGADVVITGRVADPSMFLAAIAVHHGWRLDDWTLAGRGTLVGHLLECAGQITGGYFADPGVKDVPGLARLGFPLAEVEADGTAIISKPAGSGGQVTAATCTEQLLYEIHDPSSYLTPDVVADFSRVRITDLGSDRVRVEGADGRPRPDTLKVSVGQSDGWIGEGQISYAGAGAAARGRLAGEIVAERLRLAGVNTLELRTDLIGIDALHGAASPLVEPYEVRLRVAARTTSERDARRVAREVEALFTNGPAGGGGAFTSVRPVLAIRTALVARDRVSCRVDYVRVP
ncbi:MAG TPA: acyclic terpene utilization AtuA family protein [Vicinamibacterales bacterium]|nr:acyclic terpene utilization AtuA family protein [Vicinamibacterales bacterium]